MEVSYYPGCTSHSTGKEYSMSLHEVLGALDIQLAEIEDWNCCGAAAAHSLNRKLGLALPARNIAKAQGRTMPLVIPCPGCLGAIKNAQQALSDNPELRRELEEIVDFTYTGDVEVKAVHELIQERPGLDNLGDYVKKPLAGLNVVSYYGCALVRRPQIMKMGDHENPLFLDEIVSSLGGNALDWSYKTECCGADLAMTHGDIAAEITDKIAGMAIEAGADCIMVNCGLCHVNLDMRQTGKAREKIPVFYFTELMGIAMDLSGRNRWWKKHLVNPKALLVEKELV